MKRNFILALLAFLSVAWGEAEAQNVFMMVDEQVERQQNVNLGGKASGVFVSSMGDLVITSNKKSDEFTQRKVGNMYEYEVLVDVADGDRTFKVMRKNTALTAEIKKIFRKKNQRYYFVVEEVENPIVLNEQSGRGEGYFEENKACVEFTTTLEGLKVKHSPDLTCTIEHSKLAAGAFVTSVIIDMGKFTSMRNAMEKADSAFTAWDTQIMKMGEEGQEIPDDYFDTNDTLKMKADEAEAAFNAVSYLMIFVDGSNNLSIPISDLKNKEKRLYGILPLREKVEIYNRSYDQYVGSALEAEKSRKFNTAKDFYEQAASAVDATEEEKASCRAKAAEMEECTGYWNMANQVLNKLKELKKEGGSADYGMIEECYEVAIANYQSLYKIRNDEEFQRRADVLQRALDKLGLVVEGNVVKTDMKQGRLTEEPATDVSIYACPNDYNEDMRKGVHGVFIGKVDANGNFHVQVERHIYAGLLFVPDNKKNNTWVSLKEQKHLETKVRIKD